MRVVHITTVPETLNFFRGQIAFLKQAGIEVELVSSPDVELARIGADCGVPVHGISMERKILPSRDIRVTLALWKLFRQIRPDVVHASTPKASLLGLTAAFLAGVPVRIFHVHGLPQLAWSGIRRMVLTASTAASCFLAHRVFCVSASMASIIRRYPGRDKTLVPGNGSADGADTAVYFNPERLRGTGAAEAFRRDLGIAPDAPMALFVGRLVRDKGLVELAAAWKNVQAELPEACLILAGRFESHDPLPGDTRAALDASAGVRFAGYVEDTAAAYAAADVVVLPSWREGLAYALIEAGAMGLPAIATQIPGCVDAVVDKVTGTMIPPKDSSALADALKRYLTDSDLRRLHGEAARTYVTQRFQPEPIRQQTLAEYERLLHHSRHRVYEARKRAFDAVAAFGLLILLFPILVCVAVLIRWKIGSPVLFRQVRPGREGRPFTMYKFRTMTDARDEGGNLLPDDMRLTLLGKALRASSLDELPELWNVLRGDMSLTGPRPLLMEYLPRYTPSQNRRHEVKPGITGWAQINGRNSLKWDERFELDLWYVNNRSLSVDAMILWRTLGAVISRSGIQHEGHATMPLFSGTAHE